MTKKQTGQVSVKSFKLNKKSTKPCFWLTKDEKIALFKENPNPTFIIGNLLKIQKKYFYSLMRNIYRANRNMNIL